MNIHTQTRQAPGRAGHQQPGRERWQKAWRFGWHFVEMSIAMVIGMAVFGQVAQQLRAEPALHAALRSGSDLYIIGDGLFMAVPMAAWMIWRRHGWRPSLEMGAAMIAPGLAIIALGWLGVGAYAPWLAQGACGFMCLGMLVYMLWRRDHFTAPAGHTAHGRNAAYMGAPAATETAH